MESQVAFSQVLKRDARWVYDNIVRAMQAIWMGRDSDEGMVDRQLDLLFESNLHDPNLDAKVFNYYVSYNDPSLPHNGESLVAALDAIRLCLHSVRSARKVTISVDPDNSLCFPSYQRTER